MPRRPRPLGQPTRGKTTLNRLRQVDVYIALAWSHVLTGTAPLVVDLGYGAYPWTALEMHQRWQRIHPEIRLLGVEIDAERVAVAKPYEEPGVIAFEQGGFNLTALLGQEKATIIRAYNVLRQYEENAVEAALNSMAQALAPGGLLIEGTSTPSGGLVVFDLYQRTGAGLQHREIVFGTNFHEPVTLPHFQAILPKRLIHRMLDAVPATFFERWRLALTLARGRGYTHPRRQWVEAGRILQAHYPIDTRRRILARGYLPVRNDLKAPPF